MKNFKMVLFSMLTLVLLGGCATTAGNTFVVNTGSEQEEYDPTLWVQNTGIDVVRIYQDGRKIATVYPGMGECVRLRNAQSSLNQLSFGFLANSQRWPSGQEQFGEGTGWVWNINSSMPNHSEFDIYPSERCD